ncbi:putative polysaccharide biosynthesis protein [Oceanobacillus chungangensis]|uniref:Cell division protein n=1 Tax=Oceanobacillus chungangensis TaxID=1229152 RepID=A0A3D8PKA7_9BACI|nr:polysaccharide biosynthesis protein [Oceanobacillus chungangensis]RDW15917.1 cell division protein [Oceanobacillus chungangensis]
MSNVVRSSMLLTGATFLSKFLGMIYLIPFNALVGAEGGTLYSFAYIPYTIMLSISTVGLPLAMSKIVSKYNALGDYETGRRMFKYGTSLMFVTGVVSFLILFFGAEYLAHGFMEDNAYSTITVADITMVIRMVSFALIIIPSMSIVRGFFQGYESMGPTAVSQVVEQLARILFVLISVFIVIVIMDGSIPTAVGYATFGAFIGAIASSFILFLYWRFRKPYLDQQLEQQRFSSKHTTKDLFKELFSYAGPFIIVALATSLYQLVDSFTFQRAMTAAGLGDIWEVALGAINTYGHKLVILPGTIATGLSLAILPALTKTFAQKNMVLVHKQINQALQIVLVLVIPAVVGLAALGNEAYGALYGLKYIDITGPLLAWYAPVGLLFALFTVTASILQGINQQNYTVISLLGGLLAKVLLNAQLIHMFGAKGSIIGTGLAVGIAVALNLWRIKVAVEFSFRQINKRTMLIGIFSAVMYIVIWFLKFVYGMFIEYEESRLATIIVLILGVGLGGGVYLWLAYSSTLLERVFGGRVPLVGKLKGRLARLK